MLRFYRHKIRVILFEVSRIEGSLQFIIPAVSREIRSCGSKPKPQPVSLIQRAESQNGPKAWAAEVLLTIGSSHGVGHNGRTMPICVQYLRSISLTVSILHCPIRLIFFSLQFRCTVHGLHVHPTSNPIQPRGYQTHAHHLSRFESRAESYTCQLRTNLHGVLCYRHLHHLHHLILANPARMQMKLADDWLCSLIARIAHDLPARRWLFNNAELSAPVTLHASSEPPALLQVNFTPQQIYRDHPSPPSVRDVLIVVKNRCIPLLAGFGSLPDPVGPTVGAIARHPGLADQQTNSYRTVLVPPTEKHGAALLSFMWKHSGSLVIRAHTLTPDSTLNAPTITSFRSRCYDCTDASLILKMAQAFCESSISTYLAALLPCMAPKKSVCYDVAGYDTKMQALCLFCHARGEPICCCPGPMRRRAALPTAITKWEGPVRLRRVMNREPYQGTIMTTIWERPTGNRIGVSMFTRISKYRVILSADTGWTTIQYIVSLSEKLRSVDRSISDALDEHYYCHVCDRHDSCDCLSSSRRSFSLEL